MIPRRKSSIRLEYAVLGVFASALLIGLGGLALLAAEMAPDHYRVVASRVMLFGFISLGVGFGVALLFWVYDRLLG